MTRVSPIGQFEDGATMSRIAVGCRQGALGSRDWCIRFVRDLCAYIGMTACVHECFELNEGMMEKQGISVALILMESHICIHTWPFYDALRLQVDSCKDFSKEDVEEFIRLRLDPIEIKSTKII